MFDKINTIEIVKKHLSTLVDNKTGKAGKEDYFLFYFLPIFISALLLFLEIELDKDSVAIIGGVLALFVGLFFNIIVLIFDLISKDNRGKFEITRLREIIYNISFIILLSIICIVFAFIALSNNCYIKIFAESITYSLCVLFITTVLMILKRMYIFFDDEISRKTKPKRKFSDLDDSIDRDTECTI